MIEQIYEGCLAQGAYYIRPGNEAVIIDPLREVDSYGNSEQFDHFFCDLQKILTN